MASSSSILLASGSSKLISKVKRLLALQSGLRSFQWKNDGNQGRIHLEGDFSGVGRVHSPFFTPRLATRLAAHSLRRFPHQLPPPGQPDSLPPTVSAACGPASSSPGLPRLVPDNVGGGLTRYRQSAAPQIGRA